MESTSNVAIESSDRELVITRIFDAPRALVFKPERPDWGQRHW